MKKVIWILSSLILILFGILLYSFFQIKSLKAQLSNKDTAISKQKEEIELCNNNKGKIINSYVEDYRPAAYSLSSDLFEGKQVKINEWVYKEGVIKEFIFELDDLVTVKLWDYFDKDHKDVERRIFDEYGNSSPLELSADQDFEKYKSSKGKVFIRRCGQLNASKIKTSIHSIYVQILGVGCLGFTVDEAKQVILNSTIELEEIADSLSF